MALVKRTANDALMPPPPPPKRIKRAAIVLEEDEYAAAISYIIARDYFPEVLETAAQQELLDALESQDQYWIRDAKRNLVEITTPRSSGRGARRGVSTTPKAETFSTPREWAGSTPVSIAETDITDSNEEPSKKLKVDRNLSLTQFQAKYTTDDNESFYKLIDKENLKRREKYAWLWNGNRIPTNRERIWNDRQQKLLESAQGSGGNERQSLSIKANGESSSTPDSNAVVTRSQPSGPDRRLAMPLHKPSAARNGLMFIPEDMNPSIKPSAQAADDASNAPPKSVSHAATRFSTSLSEASETPSIPPSPSLSAINDAIRGHPRNATASNAGDSSSDGPLIAGYTFVDDEPTEIEKRISRGEIANPKESAEKEKKENIASGYDLLRQLNGGDSSPGPNPFTMHEASKREDLHHRMVDKQNLQKKGGSRMTQLKGLGTPGGLSPVGRTPVLRFASAVGLKSKTGGANAGGLTPAGERLLASVGTPKREVQFGGATPRAKRKV
ncbi:MAG: hypothetical protein M1820_007698 [Bogoriella megaspora]|nr:MAG: hypothetical protein M1820_007698 [Bogoriella megaspora]